MSDPLSSIPLSTIRIFEAAARLKSFTRAAQELGVTQAAVSWQVKALEQRLAQPLFLRLPREVALTSGGERLARAATEAVNLLRTAISDITETAEGVLAITTIQTLATQWLAPRLGAFQVGHPKVAVRVDTSERTIDLVREPFDIAIRSGSGAWPGLESLWLFPSFVTPLLTPALIGQIGGVQRPEDLRKAPLIGLDEEWDAWFCAAGAADGPARAGPRLVSDLQSVEVASAMAGQGAVLASPIYFAAEIADGRLVQPFDITTDYSPGIWLAYPTDRRRSPKIAAFRDWITAVVADDPRIARFARG
ncbi:MAG TPA: LysR substrate-binding domain-containing protein [Phenylobacterium sp.]|nr:LysR substrate-binding domain-containing protein [Phenylobacterium sp.]